MFTHVRAVSLREKILHVPIVSGSDLKYSNTPGHQPLGVFLKAYKWRKNPVQSRRKELFFTITQIV